jgi:hypothetical protein
MMSKETDDEYYGDLLKGEEQKGGLEWKKYVQMFINYLKESKARDMKKSAAVV